MTRSIFKLLWTVILEDVAKSMGFRTLRALTSCQRCSDHHKSWQMILITMEALSKEIVAPYVQKCRENNVNPTHDGFLAFVNNVKNPNYTFLFHVMITYVFALILFRAGQRMNNSDAILAARVKFSPLFFGLNQTFYQEIEVRDSIARVLAPNAVCNLIKENETFTVSGSNSKGEGGDFILEAKNRKIKRMMPPGNPSDATWERVCKNADTTDKVREKLDQLIGYSEKTKSHKIRNEVEVESVRSMIRQSNYFSNLQQEVQHISVSGKPLDKELHMFASLCKGNRSLYFDDIRSGIPLGKGQKLQPIFVTMKDREEFHKIENKTKAEIQKIIMMLIQEIRGLGDAGTANQLTQMWDREIKTSTKAVMLNFYGECATCLENATEQNETREEDSEEEDY